MSERLKLKLLGRSTLKGKVGVHFPGSVTAVSPITITQNNGNYVIGIDTSLLEFEEMWFDVTDNGALGNGVANDVTAINATIAEAAAAGGGIVYFPPGEYGIGANSRILVAEDNIYLLGDGPGVSTIKLLANTTQNLVEFFDASNVGISNLTINVGNLDLSGAALIFQFCTDLIADCVEVLCIDAVGINIQGCTRFRISDCVVEKTAAAASQNEGIIATDAVQNSYGEIINNRLTNTGMDLSGEYITIAHNKISDWGFGAGITIEQSTKCHDLLISHNTCTGGVGVDTNGFHPSGIENWAKNTTITGNICASNSGAGIDQGGKNCTITGNICYDNGTSAAGFVGISARYASATYNSDNSVYSNNQSYNTNGVAGTQAWGYQEQSSSLSGIILGPNKFDTNATGSAQVLSSSTRQTTIANIELVIDGGGSVITTGVKADLEVSFTGTIISATLLADQTGSIVIDIWKDSYGNFPPTVADTITAAAKPTLAAVPKSQDITLTGWTTAITRGDTLRFNVDSAATVQRVTLSLACQKS